MSKKNIKILCSLAFLFFIILICFKIEFLDAIGYAISAAAFIDVLYDRFLWRWNPFEKTPRLYGTYKDISHSNYKGGFEYQAKAVIKQTLSSISLCEEIEDAGYTESMTAQLVPSKQSDTWKLYCTYITHPLTNPHDDMHEGTVILRVKDKTTLEGIYFTNRKRQTKGTMTLTRVSRRTSYKKFPAPKLPSKKEEGGQQA